jgi:signal transduction histidine kinase/CheY-like chemotaxis protein
VSPPPSPSTQPPLHAYENECPFSQASGYTALLVTLIPYVTTLLLMRVGVRYSFCVSWFCTSFWFLSTLGSLFHRDSLAYFLPRSALFILLSQYLLGKNGILASGTLTLMSYFFLSHSYILPLRMAQELESFQSNVLTRFGWTSLSPFYPPFNHQSTRTLNSYNNIYDQVGLMWEAIISFVVVWMLQLLNEQAHRKAQLSHRASTMHKSEFVARMSHELRTPLFGIVGTLEMLRMSKVDPQQNSLLQMGETCAKSLMALIDDILDMSKIEVGKMEFDIQLLETHKLLDESLSVVWTLANKKGINLRQIRKAELPRLFLGDRIRNRQVLINLLSNSVKFTPRNGTITLYAKRVPEINIDSHNSTHWFSPTLPIASMGGRKVDGYMAFKVKDTGIGLDTQDMHRIFNPFEQADVSVARSYGGTGLGLTISASLVAQMGGQFYVSSDGKGKGATFQYFIPYIAPTIDLSIVKGSQTQLDRRRMMLVSSRLSMPSLPISKRGLNTQTSTSSSSRHALISDSSISPIQNEEVESGQMAIGGENKESSLMLEDSTLNSKKKPRPAKGVENDAFDSIADHEEPSAAKKLRWKSVSLDNHHLPGPTAHKPSKFARPWFEEGKKRPHSASKLPSEDKPPQFGFGPPSRQSSLQSTSPIPAVKQHDPFSSVTCSIDVTTSPQNRDFESSQPHDPLSESPECLEASTFSDGNGSTTKFRPGMLAESTDDVNNWSSSYPGISYDILQLEHLKQPHHHHHHHHQQQQHHHHHRHHHNQRPTRKSESYPPGPKCAGNNTVTASHHTHGHQSVDVTPSSLKSHSDELRRSLIICSDPFISPTPQKGVSPSFTSSPTKIQSNDPTSSTSHTEHKPDISRSNPAVPSSSLSTSFCPNRVKDLPSPMPQHHARPLSVASDKIGPLFPSPSKKTPATFSSPIASPSAPTSTFGSTAVDPMGMPSFDRISGPIGTSSTMEALQASSIPTEKLPAVEIPEDIAEQRVSILVAEDNLINQRIIEMMLAKLGHRCHLAGNGLDVLKKVQEYQYDLIFMDIEMPELPGLEAAKRIRKLGISTPIVALSAHVLSEAQNSAIEAGMNQFVTKPVKVDTLRHVLSRWIPPDVSKSTRLPFN